MAKVIQEKLQYTVRDESHEDSRHSWASAESARATKGNPEVKGARNTSLFLNSLPPGMDHADAEFSDIREQHLSRGNLGNGDQFTTTRDSLERGYSKKPLSPTDAELAETGGFYDEVTVDGKTGFLERRNCMDRN
jgi:hypothetical protein